MDDSVDHGGVHKRHYYYYNRTKNYTNHATPMLTENIDIIYSLGNILWTILTTHSLWKMVPELQDI
jgi:hypothetical protein